MSEELRTDEEQVEAMRRWWNENGKSLIITVVVVLSGYLGWNAYQDSVRTQGEAASSIYQQLLTQVTKPSSEQSDADKTAMQALASQLKADYQGTLYANFAALYLAKFAIEGDNLDAAVTELSALVEGGSDAPIKYLAQGRLARVYLQQQKLDEALALVITTPEAAFTAQFEEVKGDVYFAKGEFLKARTAYQAAQTAASGLGMNTQTLQRKIDDLAGAQEDA